MAMTVQVTEQGERPVILTAARRFAPQAAKALGELFYELSSQGRLGQHAFGDAAFVVLDWTNETGQLPVGATVKPILYLQVQRHWPDGTWLKVESRIDVDEVFASDLSLNRDILSDIVMESLQKLADESAKKTEASN